MTKIRTQSAPSWPHHLFEQVSQPVINSQGKTPYAHRDDDSLNDIKQNAFRALFAENKNELQVPESSSFKKNFESEFLLPANTIGDESSDYRLTVLNCYNETLDTKTFVLGKPKDRPFDYLPGQYLTLCVVIEGKQYKRSYSLASPPSRQGCLEITVKRDSAGGLVSNWLNDHLMVGDKVDAKGPFGKFTCANRTNNKILFLAAGSGIVPIMSMLRWLTDLEAKVDIALLLSFTTLSSIIFRDELNLLALRHNNVKLSVTLTKEPIALSGWTGLLGRVDEKMIAQHVPDLTDRDVYLCGPNFFMSDCKVNLLKLKLPITQLLTEHFTVNSLRPLEQMQACASDQPARKINGHYRIRFAKSDKTVATDGNTSLLELAEKHGIRISHECRSGNCGECMVKCLSGNIEMTEQAEIDNLDRKKGWVYSCCAYPLSNAVLDA